MTVEKNNSSFSVVVVSSRKAVEKISACLSSLFQSSYPASDFEVIVVDSGAGASVHNYLRKEGGKHLNLRLIFPGKGNIGPARGRNLGINCARGEIIAFTDDDLVLPADWLGRLADGYRRYPDVAGVGGIYLPPKEAVAANVFAYYENRLYRNLLQKPEGEYLSDKRDEHPCYTGNISYRKEILQRVGGFNEEYLPQIYGEDGDLKERVLKLGCRLLYLPLVARHQTDYNFRQFWQKEERRGLGILFYRRSRFGRKPNRYMEILKIIFFPVVLMREFKAGGDLKFGLLAALSFIARQAGKWRYYDQI